MVRASWSLSTWTRCISPFASTASVCRDSKPTTIQTMKRLVTIVVLVLLITGVVLAFRWLPWWALVIGFLLLILIGKFVLKRLLKKLFLMPFRAKGAVLRGATATVHSVSPTSAPLAETGSETPA